MMKVVQVLPSMRRAGAESVVAMLSRGLAEAGHESHLVVISNRFEYERELKRSNVKIHVLGLLDGRLRFFQRLKRYQIEQKLYHVFKSIEPDILHTHLSHSLLWAAPAIKTLGLTCFYTSHGIDPTLRGDGYRNRWRRTEFIEAVMSTRCRLLAVSNSCAKQLERNLGPDIGTVGTQPNPVDLERFHPGTTPPSSLSPVVFMIGTLYEVKRVRIGIRAVAALKSLPGLHLRVVGDGPERRSMGEMVEALDCASRVEFLGLREDVPELLRSANILWLLSEREGMPMVALEAMASGVPVIATDVSGTNELIQDGINGLLVPLDNPNAVADATLRLLRDPTLVCYIAEGGLRTARRFNLQAVVKQHLRRYREEMHGLIGS
jgi:glycosyltransferase involved in cell wall biosynthesis